MIPYNNILPTFQPLLFLIPEREKRDLIFPNLVRAALKSITEGKMIPFSEMCHTHAHTEHPPRGRERDFQIHSCTESKVGVKSSSFVIAREWEGVSELNHKIKWDVWHSSTPKDAGRKWVCEKTGGGGGGCEGGVTDVIKEKWEWSEVGWRWQWWLNVIRLLLKDGDMSILYAEQVAEEKVSELLDETRLALVPYLSILHTVGPSSSRVWEGHHKECERKQGDREELAGGVSYVPIAPARYWDQAPLHWKLWINRQRKNMYFIASINSHTKPLPLTLSTTTNRLPVLAHHARVCTTCRHSSSRPPLTYARCKGSPATLNTYPPPLLNRIQWWNRKGDMSQIEHPWARPRLVAHFAQAERNS